MCHAFGINFPSCSRFSSYMLLPLNIFKAKMFSKFAKEVLRNFFI
ncbi:hypothetical protein ASZ90_000070 [hydrocarbon metagenome]|uniref:Uncharacterized protein n=1 Tax=hydrocarbon metagenome TaxID=938273 RepID=A0A0W8GA59_9ZZZZ